MPTLCQQSIKILLDHQSPSGAYVASPSFHPYAYCWFRDGAFAAYAMDLHGEHTSAMRFHTWAAATINARAERVQRGLEKASRGEPLQEDDILHTRYTLEGQEAPEPWPNFQLDGFGTWLWSLMQHRACRGSPLPSAWLEAADLAAVYLRSLWRKPCFDCWEEFPEKIHTYTLAAIHGGLHAHAALTREPDGTPAEVETFIRTRLGGSSGFVKYLGSAEVDASLLGLATPYRVVLPTDPWMRTTVAHIESELRAGGGVHRYRADSYYGGGEWVLLTAWLGWHYLEAGEPEKALEALRWVEEQADDQGQLPEQVPVALNDPALYEPWRRRWGNIARPLLWSHAKYLILVAGLRAAGLEPS